MKKFYISIVLLVVVQLTSFASEFNLRVLRNGQHTVAISSQSQTNNTNFFQFYQLQGTSFLLTVKDRWTNAILFNNYVTIPENQRVQAELDLNGTLRILESATIYNSGEFVGNVAYENNFGYPVPNNGNNPYHNHCGTPSNNSPYFNQFLNQLSNESFDSKRLEKAKNYAKQTYLSTHQIKQIAMLFSFDSSRLSWTKFAYNRCADKMNYFILEDAFTFSSNYNELMHTISQ